MTKLGFDDKIRKTGAITRAALIADFPGLLVDAFDHNASKLPAHLEKRSDNVAIYVFDGELTEFEIHSHARQNHFEFKEPRNLKKQVQSLAKTATIKP